MLSIEEQMLLHAVSSSPREHRSSQGDTTHKPRVIAINKMKAKEQGVQEIHSSGTFSIELEEYTPPTTMIEEESETGLSLAHEVQTLLPPEFNISPSSSSSPPSPTDNSGQNDEPTAPTSVTATENVLAVTDEAKLSVTNLEEDCAAPNMGQTNYPLPSSTISESRLTLESTTMAESRPIPEESLKALQLSEKDILAHAAEGNKDVSPKREMDDLVLLGNGFISSGVPSDGALQDQERDFSELRVGYDQGFFLPPPLQMERPDKSMPAKPSQDQPEPVRKERRASILQTLFSVRWFNHFKQEMPSHFARRLHVSRRSMRPHQHDLGIL